MMSCRSSGSTPDLTSGGQLLGDFEVAITGGIWVAAGAIDMSKLAWWIDGFNFFIEKNLHDAIEPGIEWKGLWPQYGYVAPPDWKTR